METTEKKYAKIIISEQPDGLEVESIDVENANHFSFIIGQALIINVLKDEENKNELRKATEEAEQSESEEAQDESVQELPTEDASETNV